MKNKKSLRTGLMIVLGLLLLIQFFQIDKTKPPVDPAKDFIQVRNPPSKIAMLLKNACYDCHSNHTKYPWYTNVQPIAWWIKSHVNNGRRELNFSDWATYSEKKQAHKLEECYEMVEGTEMPLLSYMIAHREAWLDEAQRAELVEWFKLQK